MLLDDEVPEGIEGFRAGSTPDVGSPPFQAPQTNMVFQSTEIYIIDDDCELTHGRKYFALFLTL